MSDPFEIKDSGERMTFDTGMVRDSGAKILRPDLLWVPGLIRLAEHYGKGALKYAERNWEKAATEVEMLRFRASAFRHFMQWFRGDRDEDHASATIFNMWGAEMVKGKLDDASITETLSVDKADTGVESRRGILGGPCVNPDCLSCYSLRPGSH